MAVDKKTDTNINRTTYKCYPSTGRGTINTATTLNVNFGTISAAVSVLITNFDTTNDILVKLNFSTNDSIVVKGNSTLTLNSEYVTRVFLTNSSGSAVQYQVVLIGG